MQNEDESKVFSSRGRHWKERTALEGTSASVNQQHDALQDITILEGCYTI